jgi:hypothetical protein
MNQKEYTGISIEEALELEPALKDEMREFWHSLYSELDVPDSPIIKRIKETITDFKKTPEYLKRTGAYRQHIQALIDDIKATT